MRKEGRMKKNIKLLLMFLFVCFGNVFGFKMQSSDETLGDEAKNYFLVLKRDYLHYKGTPAKTLEALKTHEMINGPAQSKEGLIRILFDINQFDKIAKLFDETKGAFDNDLEIQLIFAQSFLNLSQDEKAESIFKKMSEKFPDNEQVAYYTAVSYIKNNQIDKALNFINQCIEKQGLRNKHFLFYFLKSKIYSQLGMNKEALEFIEKSLDLFPRFDKGWLLKALLEEQLGRVNDAIKGYKSFLDLVGRDAAVEKQLVHLLFSQQRFGEAADVLRGMEVDSPEYFFDLALIDFKAGKQNLALESIEKALQKFPDFRKARLLKVEILLSQNQKEKALDFMKDWIIKDAHDNAVIRILILLRRSGVSIDSIIKVLEGVVQKNGDDVGILSVLADLYLEKDDYNKVLEYCKKLFAAVKSGELKSKILFQTAYIYFVTNEEVQMVRVLKEAIKYNPVYPSAYNLLAYHYAQNDKNLNDALKLADFALKTEPNCYYYIDTKGFVLFKMGKIKEAEELFARALQLSPDDKVIGEHLELAKNFGK